MQQQLSVLVLAACLPAIAGAQSNRSYPCTNGNLTRRVEVAYTGAGEVPCEVRYHKDTEAPGMPEVLWSATNDAGYCEAQARDFVARLQALGWTCSDAGSSGAPQARAPAVRADDTAVLGAGR
jgi:hypothetical protein